MSVCEKVLDTARLVMERASQVFIDRGAAARYAGSVLEGQKPPPWHGPFHYFDGTEKSAQYIFLLTTINHCFWAPKGKERWTVEEKGETLDGYDALALALKRAVIAESPILDAGYLSGIAPEALREILGGRGELFLMEERAASLRDAGRVLKERWQDSFARVVEAAEKSAQNLVSLVIEEFPSFRDTATYGGREICFYKRAQLLAADLFSAFGREGLGEFSDTDKLTAFADYKLPQVLREMGVIAYSSDLAAKVDSMEELPPGSREEVEIRAATIIAVDAMRAHLAEMGRAVNSMDLDYRLWREGQRDEYRKRPYHRTRTLFY